MLEARGGREGRGCDEIGIRAPENHVARTCLCAGKESSLSSSLRGFLEAAGRARSATQPVWDLASSFWPFGKAASPPSKPASRQILEWLLRRVPLVYLAIDADEEMTGVLGARRARAAVHLATSVERCRLPTLPARALFYGGWSLYGCRKPLQPDDLPDSFRCSPADLVANLRRMELSVLKIQAWWDDVD